MNTPAYFALGGLTSCDRTRAFDARAVVRRRNGLSILGLPTTLFSRNGGRRYNGV